MFSSVLLAEEVMSPLSTNEDNINPNELFSKIVRTLLKDEKLKAVLNVRKGKVITNYLLDLIISFKLYLYSGTKSSFDIKNKLFLCYPKLSLASTTCFLRVLNSYR